MIRNKGYRKIVAHVVIRCPHCESLQRTIEEEITCYPFLIYCHRCSECRYWIMESEWDVVKVLRRAVL